VIPVPDRPAVRRRKSLWRWQPFPFIVLFAAAVVASAIPPTRAPVAFGIAIGVLVLVAVVVLLGLLVEGVRRRVGPDADGNLRSLDGLRIVEAAGSDSPPTPVVESLRHQSAIDAADAFGGARMRAVLVPGASRWLGITLRVGVQLVAGERVYHVGFLEERTGAGWMELLMPLRDRGAYVSVPATISMDRRPFQVTLDLGGVRESVRSAESQ
jgi:hypothetical protein